jgi:hypothetical protein
MSNARNLAQAAVTPLSFKNRIMNPCGIVNQRGAESSTAVGINVMDRWGFYRSATGGAASYGRDTNATLAVGYPQRMYMQCTTASTPGSNSYTVLQQKIEGYNIADFKWGTANAKPVTVSFRGDCTVAGIYSVTLKNEQSGAGLQTYVVPVAMTPGPKTYSFTVPGCTTGTWDVTNGMGMVLVFALTGHTTGANATSSGSTWVNGNFFIHSSQTNGEATAGNALYITEVQVEVGAVATAFEFRPVNVETAMCQRYFYTPGRAISSTSCGVSGQNYVSMTLFYPVRMRLAPTVTFTDDQGTNNYVLYRSQNGGTLSRGTAQYPDASDMCFELSDVSTSKSFMQIFNVKMNAEL